MMRWSRAHTLIAGAALVVLTNAVALIGVERSREQRYRAPAAVARAQGGDR